MSQETKSKSDKYIWTILAAFIAFALGTLVTCVTGMVSFLKLYDLKTLDQLEVLKLIATLLATLVAMKFTRTMFDIFWHFMWVHMGVKEMEDSKESE